jgi:hypothetical protein
MHVNYGAMHVNYGAMHVNYGAMHVNYGAKSTKPVHSLTTGRCTSTSYMYGVKI